MKIFNLHNIKAQKGDSFAKDAVMIFGNQKNAWQGEVLETCTENIDAVLLHLKNKEEIKLHHHGDSEEIIYILKGEGIILQENSKKQNVKEGDLIFLEKNIRHSIKGSNAGLSCLCFHAPAMNFRG